MAEAKPRDEQRPLLIFLHIPKTGGSSFGHVFRRAYGSRSYILKTGGPKTNLESLKRILEEDPYKYDVIGGHLSSYGVHELTDRPVRYFAMLRNPTNRAISQYYHNLRNQHSKRNQKFAQADNIIDALPMLNRNLMTRVIAGHGPGSTPTAEDLETAKRNITEHFVTVGTLERIDETVMLLKHLLGWSRLIATPYKNKGSNRPRKLPPEVYEQADQLNQYDFELYRFADDLLTRQISEAGFAFKWDTLRLRARESALNVKRTIQKRVQSAAQEKS